MNKSSKTIVLLIIGILILIMAGCSNIKQVNSPPDSPTNSQQNSPKNDVNETNSVLPASENMYKDNESSDSEESPYYGTWVIKRVVPTSNVTALTTESVNDYIGKKIIVNEKQIVTSKGTIENPVYQENILTDDDLYMNNRIHFSSLEVTDNTVTGIDVSNYQHETENGIGATFILTNDNRVYTIIGGGLFELSK